MVTTRILGSLALALVLGATSVLVRPAAAHDFEHGDLLIVHPVARPSMGAAANSAAYMTIENGGAHDRLVAASSDIAARVELHTTVEEDGVLKMQEVAEGIAIPANNSATLETGGHHVMLMGLAEPLRVDDRFMLTLEFENAGPIDVEVYVVHPEELGGAIDMEHDH